MTTNDILRRTRYAFDYNDIQMMEFFASGGNGFINAKRGKKEGVQPVAEKILTNNIVLRKFKIAMNWRDEDILETLMLGDMKFSKHELSALFRKPTHTHYRLCKDQLIRKLLIGMHRRYRPTSDIEE